MDFCVARAKLRDLAKSEMLPRASEVAYGEGIAGLTRLADACLEDLTQTDDCVHIALQWDAIAADGTLFTTLLADLTLKPAGDQLTVLSVAGTYWPPPGRSVAGLGQADVCRCAAAVVSSFLDRVACELLHPAGAT